MGSRKALSPKASARATQKLSKWGECPNQGELISRKSTSKVTPAQVRKGKR